MFSGNPPPLHLRPMAQNPALLAIFITALLMPGGNAAPPKPLHVIVATSENAAGTTTGHAIQELWRTNCPPGIQATCIVHSPRARDLLLFLKKYCAANAIDADNPLLIVGPTNSDALQSIDLVHTVLSEFDEHGSFLDQVYFWCPSVTTPINSYPQLKTNILLIGKTDREKVTLALSKILPKGNQTPRLGVIAVSNAFGLGVLGTVAERAANDQIFREDWVYPHIEKLEARQNFAYQANFEEECLRYWKRVVRANASIIFIAPEHDIQVTMLLNALRTYNDSGHWLQPYQPHVIVLRALKLSDDQDADHADAPISQLDDHHAHIWISSDLSESARGKSLYLAVQEDILEILSQLRQAGHQGTKIINALKPLRTNEVKSAHSWATMAVAERFKSLAPEAGWQIMQPKKNGRSLLEFAYIENRTPLGVICHRLSDKRFLIVWPFAVFLAVGLVGRVVVAQSPQPKKFSFLKYVGHLWWPWGVTMLFSPFIGAAACFLLPWDISPFWLAASGAAFPFGIIFFDTIVKSWMAPFLPQSISIPFDKVQRFLLGMVFGALA